MVDVPWQRTLFIRVVAAVNNLDCALILLQQNLFARTLDCSISLAMAANANKVLARLSTLDESLDALEAQLEPLFAQTLPETIAGLDKMQQAKLQVAIPYIVYDLIFGVLSIRACISH